MEIYKVRRAGAPVNGTVVVPGSKSVTNRALFMAAMAEGKSVLKGTLFSDDSRHFADSLKSLGYNIVTDEKNKRIEIEGHRGAIPFREGTIDVGSAGTAARFLTAMLALSDGQYVINASEQMKARPMEPLFDALAELGAEFEYLEEKGHLPVRVTGRRNADRRGRKEADGTDRKVAETIGTEYDGTGRKDTECGSAVDCGVPPACAHIDISSSTQFLSALMMAGVLVDEGLDIAITSKKTDGSYIRITAAMMKDFGCEAVYDGHDYHIVSGQEYKAGEYYIEPDISAACYFWAMAAVTGGSVTVKGTRYNMMQGDMKFLDVLKKMGCTVAKGQEGICVTGPAGGRLNAADVDMNDFSDQTMTLAAIAPFAAGTTYIRNIGHIRLQESDRIEAILENLRSMGIACGTVMEDEKEGIYIEGGSPHPASIKTYNDHRMAMAFAVTGLRAEGIIIENPKCCGKTFEDYFDVLEKVVL